MLNSTRKRDSNPPNYTDLERNSIPQLQIILSELGVVPPSTSDRDELIQLIKLKITPRKQQRRRMYQKSVIDDDSPVENNFSGNEDFNVSNDQYDDAPISNENNENSQNGIDLNGKDENAPSAESMLADDELSNSAFEADSSIVTPQRPSSKLFPSKEQLSKIESEEDTNQYQNAPDESDTFGWGSTSQSDSMGWGSTSGSSSQRHSPVRRHRITPPKQIPTSSQRKENKTNYINSNKKRTHRNKYRRDSNSNLDLISIIWLLLLFLLFLLLFFLILALIPLPGESKYLPHCPKHGSCNEKREGNTTRYNLYLCEQNYKLITSGLIQICAPSDSTMFNEYKYTLDAAAYISQVDGDCFFNKEHIDLEHIRKMHPNANPTLLTTDNDFLTVLIGDEFKSNLPNYEATCRAFHACDNSPILTGLVVLLAFIASYVIVKRFSHFFK